MKAMTAPKSGRKIGAVYQKDVKNDFGKMWVYTITNPSTINHTAHFIVANDLVADFSKMWHLMMLRQSQPSKGRI